MTTNGASRLSMFATPWMLTLRMRQMNGLSSSSWETNRTPAKISDW